MTAAYLIEAVSYAWPAFLTVVLIAATDTVELTQYCLGTRTLNPPSPKRKPQSI